MKLLEKWNEYMGPKDERLEVQEGKQAKIGAYILLVGSVISLYYAIMVSQVAFTTDNPILTPLGETVVPVTLPLTLTILLAGIATLIIQTRQGFTSSRMRYAEVKKIPWEFVLPFSVLCGIILGLLTCIMRILAEVQIVGIGQVAWFGDLAIGIVFFVLGTAIGFVALVITFYSAIKRRQSLEDMLEE